jgi:ABC-type nitrate/sulfonate/bicarbonate transport system substrate-binding protein
MIRTLLVQQGIPFHDVTDEEEENDDEAVNIVDLTGAPDVGAAILRNDGESEHFALLPEPAATAISLKTEGKFSVQLDLQEEWQSSFSDLRYPQSGLIVRTDVLENADYKDFLFSLLVAVRISAEQAMSDPAQAVELAQDKLGSVALTSAEAVEKAIDDKRLNMVADEVAGDQAERRQNKNSVVSYLTTILNSGESAASLIGGKLPDESFYAYIEPPKN